MMSVRIGAALIAMIGLMGCAETADRPVNDADAAVAKAMVAIKKEFPQGHPNPTDFHAYLRDGNWYVEEIMQPGSLGGGVGAVVSQRDGKVMQVALIQ
jgi:hypothetical protein